MWKDGRRRHGNGATYPPEKREQFGNFMLCFIRTSYDNGGVIAGLQFHRGKNTKGALKILAHYARDWVLTPIINPVISV